MNAITYKTPTITVFMAVFNGARYIKQAISSVLAQSFTDFELLIVNDGSTDNTLEIIAEFKDSRIRLLHNDGNKGLTYSRNHGLKEAKGKYFAILDSDDIAMPGRLALQFNFMNDNPNVAICGGQAKFIDDDGKEIKEYLAPVGNNLSYQLAIYNILINSSLMMKTDVMREVGGYREMSPAEDYDLSFRIGLKHQIANLSDQLVAYREHASNTSRVQTEKLNNALRRIVTHIHTNLNVQTDQHLIDVHHHFITSNFAPIDLHHFEELLKKLKDANNKGNTYSPALFDKFLFNIWFALLRSKKVKGIISLYFRTPLFDWSFVTFKQLRKVMKQYYFLNLSFYKKSI
jgi:glycosyltransferase involved in cell wall biosynthesis